MKKLFLNESGHIISAEEARKITNAIDEEKKLKSLAVWLAQYLDPMNAAIQDGREFCKIHVDKYDKDSLVAHFIQLGYSIVELKKDDLGRYVFQVDWSDPNSPRNIVLRAMQESYARAEAKDK